MMFKFDVQDCVELGWLGTISSSEMSYTEPVVNGQLSSQTQAGYKLGEGYRGAVTLLYMGQ